MRIAVIGTGYVGLIQAVGMAEMGHDVTAIDIDPQKIEQLQAGQPTLYEEGLAELLTKHYQRMHFTTQMEAVQAAEVIFLCVGTPQDGQGKTNLQYMLSACDSVRSFLSPEQVMVIKSTVPVGTNEKIRTYVDQKVHVVSNPEFLREGKALDDFFDPERVVVGFHCLDDQHTRDVMRQVYQSFVAKHIPYMEVSRATAELIKYASNSFLATKISFINEMARLADATGADVTDIAQGMGYDTRIGPDFLNAGIGYGGSCFPKDVRSLVWQFHDHDLTPHIIEQTTTVNDTQVEYAMQLLQDCAGNLQGQQVAVLGLAFKPGTDDIRESRAISVIDRLIEHGAMVRGYDPIAGARDNMQSLYTHRHGTRTGIPLVIVDEISRAVVDADVVIVALEDKLLREQDRNMILKQMRGKIIFDAKNILDPDQITGVGGEYVGVGRA